LKRISTAANAVTKGFPNVANSHMNSFQKAAAISIKHPQNIVYVPQWLSEIRSFGY
jgi:hypothetical protein